MRWSLLIVMAVAGPMSPAQESNVAPEPPSSESALDRFTEEARQYVFSVPGSELVFHPKPILHWTNPARGGEDGALWLWSHGASPVVIGTCFTYQYAGVERRKHAFLLVSDHRVEGRHRGRVMWSPRHDQLDYLPVPGAPAVATTEARRSTQLRGIARRFGTVLTLKDGRTEQCRLIPQPLHRFDDPDLKGDCGAIFSFAVGTDPEALLILRRQNDDAGKPAWYYAFGRFTFYPLEGLLDGNSVWKAQPLENMMGNILLRADYQREHYITFRPDWLD